MIVLVRIESRESAVGVDRGGGGERREGNAFLKITNERGMNNPPPRLSWKLKRFVASETMAS